MKRIYILLCAIAVGAMAVIVGPAEAAMAVNPPPGTILWLRSDAGTDVTSGARVANWYDQSGNGHHASMGTNARRPTYVTPIIGQKPSIWFDGTNSLTLATPVSSTLLTVFVVGRNVKAGSAASVILGPGGDLPNNQLQWGGDTQATFYSATNGTTTTTIGDIRTNHVLAVRVGAGSVRTYRDGVLKGTRSQATAGTWQVGSVGSFYSSVFLTGYLYEVMVYPAMSDTDFATTSSYLRGKYGLP